jgi:hypothetical protein
MWRIEEIGFAAFGKFVSCFEPSKMIALIDFLFDPVILQTTLKTCWVSILDEQFVKEKVIDPMSHYSSNAIQLQESLYALLSNGMVIKKSIVPPVASEPFLLTVPKERKLPIPTALIPKVIKVKSTNFRLLLSQKIYSKHQSIRKTLKIKENNAQNKPKNY